ncbi:MAG TPA: hypothetical protein VKY32_03755 [Flavobacterium sp.]|nr:hypothetical protein [Flavobacterium sp.]
MKRKVRYIGWILILFPLGIFAQTNETTENTPDPIAVVNGYIVRYSDLARLKSEYIATITELDSEDAMKLFGDRAKGGAIVVKLIGRNTIGTGEKIEEELITRAEKIAEAKEAERQRLAEEKAKAEEAERQRLAEQQVEEVAQENTAAHEDVASEEVERQRLAEEKAKAEEAERQRLAEEKAKAEEAERQRLAEEKAKAEEAERQRLAEEKAKAEEAERQRLAEEKAKAEEAKAKEESRLAFDFAGQLQKDFEKSVKDPKVKKILVNGKEVTKEEALKINVFDVETSIVTYNTEKTESVLEIRLTQKN